MGRFHPYQELLDQGTIKLLGDSGGRVYQTIWNLMDRDGVSDLRLSDATVSVKSKVTIQGLEAAKSALVRLGLFDVMLSTGVSDETRWLFPDAPDDPHGAETH